MATQSSIFAWEIPWTEDLGGLPSMLLHWQLEGRGLERNEETFAVSSSGLKKSFIYSGSLHMYKQRF